MIIEKQEVNLLRQSVNANQTVSVQDGFNHSRPSSDGGYVYYFALPRK